MLSITFSFCVFPLLLEPRRVQIGKMSARKQLAMELNQNFACLNTWSECIIFYKCRARVVLSLNVWCKKKQQKGSILKIDDGYRSMWQKRDIPTMYTRTHRDIPIEAKKGKTKTLEISRPKTYTQLPIDSQSIDSIEFIRQIFHFLSIQHHFCINLYLHYSDFTWPA